MGMSDKQRSMNRREAARERERIALELFIRGRRHVEIAERLDVHPDSVSAIVRRALERRAAQERPTVEAARVVYLEQVGELIRAWWPLATGTYVVDEETGEPLPPDPKAAEIVMKLIDKQAAAMAQGVVPDPRKLGEIDLVHKIDNSQVQDLRDQIMNSLAAMAQKAGAIEGEFAEVGHDFERAAGRVEIDTKPAPPPTREKAA
jgi:DNA-binding CsgD family transcriptional regulator